MRPRALWEERVAKLREGRAERRRQKMGLVSRLNSEKGGVGSGTCEDVGDKSRKPSDGEQRSC